MAVGNKAIHSIHLALLAIFILGLYLVGVNELILLIAGGAANLFFDLIRNRPFPSFYAIILLPIPGLLSFSTGSSAVSLISLFLSFVKIGSILYGSGYVLLAFLHSEFVVQQGWLPTSS